jgi:uncharacterized membrane protein YvbJ
MYCSKCGLELKETDKFCSNCGTSVKPDMDTDNQDMGNDNTKKPDEIKIHIDHKEKSGINKTVITVVLIIVGCIVAFFAYQEYQRQQAIRHGADIFNSLFRALGSN